MLIYQNKEYRFYECFYQLSDFLFLNNRNKKLVLAPVMECSKTACSRIWRKVDKIKARDFCGNEL